VSVSAAASAEWTFAADPRAAGRARRAVREALETAGAAQLRDVAELVVSELVTNAVVHAGTQMLVRITAEPTAVRVEIGDGSHHLPVRRRWAETAGTGRGLRIVDEHVDRWGADLTDGGKVVWFEIGRPTTGPVSNEPSGRASPSVPESVAVTLLAVPLLMHWAWQEHAATLLREYLLYALEREGGALEDHAAASSALSVLEEQLPTPRLPTQPDALMASAIEPAVTAAHVTLKLDASVLRHFSVLDDLLVRAVAAAEDGRLLSPPTQPEMAEMRAWLCREVARQAEAREPEPWRPRTDVREPLDTGSSSIRGYRARPGEEEPGIVTDDRSVIVAVSPRVVELLGYAGEADLVGRRILVVVPARFHQAHVAGTTLHVTNGRDVLLDRWLTVPVVRADGTEVPVELHVESRLLDGGSRAFVARLRW
jgi:PAS domain S-box-containing protein